METSRDALAAFIRDHEGEILALWDRAAARVHAARLPHALLRDEIGRVLDKIAARLASSRLPPAGTVSLSLAVGEHVLQRAEKGVSLAVVAAEILALRDAIERAWPATDLPESREALRALREAIERVVLDSIERFTRVRMALLDAVDLIVRQYPGETLEKTLQNMLRALFGNIEGIDSATVLLREDGHLRVRATVGLEEEIAVGFTLGIGEGFAGLIAAERLPRLLRDAAADPLVRSPAIHRAGIRALYGVPLLRGDDLLGVAHMGSKSAPDFSDDAKGLFRVIMDRVAGVLYQEMLRERLVSEQARNREVIENAPTVIYSKNLEGRYLTINRRALAEFGLLPEDFVGRTDHDVFPRETADALRENDRRVVERRATLESEEEFLRGGERRTYLSVKFPLFDARGRLVGVGGVSTDITDRRRAARGHQLLAEAGGLLASSLDYRETLSDVSDRVVRQFADCIIADLVDDAGIIWRALVRHRDPGKSELAWRLQTVTLDRSRPHLVEAVLRSRDPVYMPQVSPEYLDTIAQGVAHRQMLRDLDPTSMIQIPLLARGRLLGAFVFLRCGPSPRFDRIDLQLAGELGWRISLAIENARLYEESRRASRARDEVLGVVAHDLRNPLGTIVLSAHRVAVGLAPGAGAERRAIDAIASAASRMDKLVSDLLDQHAIESGQFSVEARPCLASGLVREAAEAERDALRAASLSLELSLSRDLPYVFADRDRVHQVFANLIDNSAKFTPPGGKVIIGATPGEGEVRFFVSDSGPGFRPDVLQHLFDRFWQERPSDRRGAGLGLAICKGIVEAHGGRIWASREGVRGATVSFTLPEAPAGAVEAAEPDRLH